MEDLYFKKQYLKRYRRNQACVRRLELKVEEARRKETRLNSPSYGERISGGVPKTKEELIIDRMELEERLQALKHKGRELKKQTTEIIDQIDDPKIVEVMELYFIDCMDIEEIAIMLCYTRRNVDKLYHKGLTQIVISI